MDADINFDVLRAYRGSEIPDTPAKSRLGRRVNIDYFHLPLWLCVGAIAFSIAISLVSGIYPAVRASRIDPVVALRHD